MFADVTPVSYRSHRSGYRLDIEVLDAAELRRRVESIPHRGYERADFLSLVFVRSGWYSHVVDFRLHECGARSCLVIRPGEVHRFGPVSEWAGWILIAGAQRIPAAVADLPTHIRLDGVQADAVAELLERIAADTRSSDRHDALTGLLALQTDVLVRRLGLGAADQTGVELVDPVLIERHREFRAAVEREFHTWHQVGPYARHLGLSAKSLDRSSRAVASMTAKRVIVERVVLEAKRLLAQGADPIATVSDRLGFDEPTNFVKYFKRETGTTPAQFRLRLADREPS